MPGRRLFLLPVLAVVLGLLLAAPAMAGRLVATGHDADLHCSGGSQCGYVRTAVNWVRAGAPDPAKPVLVLDNGSIVSNALDRAFGAGVVPRTVVDPATPAFTSTPLSPANFSAMIVASDITCGGCDLNTSSTTPQSDAIKARAGDVATFFNAGGGIIALAGASHGGAVPGTTGLENRYYEFVPLPLGGAPVSPPFTLTPVGTSIGFTDNMGDSDINCCPTHNSFNLPPAGSALQVAENDSKGLAETLVADGKISGGGIVPPSTPTSAGSGTLPPGATGAKALPLPSAKRCTSRRAFPIRVRKYPGVTWDFAIVSVNNKRVPVYVYKEKRVRVSRIGGLYLNARKRLRAFVDLRGLAKGTYRVRISAVTTAGEIRTNTRNYRTCSRKLGGTIPRL
jgi:hypothetical protein